MYKNSFFHIISLHSRMIFFSGKNSNFDFTGCFLWDTRYVGRVIVAKYLISYSSLRNRVNMKRTQMVSAGYSSSVNKSPVTTAPFFPGFSILTASVKPKVKFLFKCLISEKGNNTQY